MFIAMNRFRIIKGKESEFERIWLDRETYLDEAPGFVEFHLLRGSDDEDHTLFISHTIWQSKEYFERWTTSESFRKAHANAGGRKKNIYMGPPNFEGFDTIQTIKKSQ